MPTNPWCQAQTWRQQLLGLGSVGLGPLELPHSPKAPHTASAPHVGATSVRSARLNRGLADETNIPGDSVCAKPTPFRAHGELMVEGTPSPTDDNMTELPLKRVGAKWPPGHRTRPPMWSPPSAWNVSDPC